MFRVIPVIDLSRGNVVRARAGDRDAYAPIESPLARGCAPADIARGLLDACPADTLYVADLDAIVEGVEPDREALLAVARACPGATLWVDAGFREMRTVARFLAWGLGRPVLGSESQCDAELVRALGGRAVLSLDSRSERRLDPAALHDRPDLWPDDVIVMTLGRVGTDDGPDVSAVKAAKTLRPSARIHAAGGVRGAEDLAALKALGADGALVASAIHDGRVGSAP